MKTILDNCKTLFLDELHYNESLQLMVSEGILLNENHSIKIGKGTIDNVKPIVITENSKKFKIEFDFDDIINFQVTVESYTMFDNNEITDTNGFLQIILKSDYLSYVEKSHGWYKDVIDKEGKHYRLWTESDIVDIISVEEPKIEILKKN